MISIIGGLNSTKKKKKPVKKPAVQRIRNANGS